MDLGLSGKVALVTGASRGIGLAIARAFLAEGAKVCVTGRDGAALEQARAELATLGSVLAVRADMTQDADIRRALHESEAGLGPLDAVVANVGNGSGKPGHVLDTADWQSMLSTNLLGGMALAAQVLPRLSKRQGGSLTFVSSIAGLEAVGAPAPYAAAKAALHAACGSFARQVGGDGVRVNCLAPGNVLFPGGSWERKLADRPGVFEGMVEAEVPLRRFATPGEIADVAVFLASSRAAFVTGAVWVVDGGQTRSFT